MIVTVVVFFLTLGLALWKPRGIHEAVWTMAGALFMLATKRVSMADLREVAHVSRPALLFLIALLILAALVDRSGLFEWAALHAAKRARGDGKVLFRNVFVLGALVTALLSLDTTAVLLTPVVLVLVRRLSIPGRPFVIACAFVANAASLPLPISNLTNLIFAQSFELAFARFVLQMVPVQVVVLLATYWILRAWFAKELVAFAGNDEEPASVIPDRGYFRVTLVVLAVATIAYFIAPLVHVEPYAIAFAATAVLAVGALRAKRADRKLIGEISWGVVPFVIGLFVVVQAVVRTGLAEHGARFVEHFSGALPRLLATTFGSGLLANVVNNLPATLVARVVLQRLHAEPSLVYATLIGTNVGPNLVPFGSLASVLVLGSAKRRGIDVSFRDFFVAGLVTTPIVCLLAALTLHLVRAR